MEGSVPQRRRGRKYASCVRVIRNNLMAVLFVVAIVASFFAANETSRQRVRAQRTHLVADCEKASYRSALLAAFAFDAAATRRAAGDIAPAAKYASVARGIMATIPPPRSTPTRDLVQIAYVNGVARPTPRAAYLQRLGCELAFP